jgi:hypothetical protein
MFVNKQLVLGICLLAAMLFGGFGCEQQSAQIIERGDKIPSTTVKISPQADLHPPVLHSTEFEKPVPVPGPINTAGAEDSPFIMPDGNTLYFFFTPDPNIPAEKQLDDGVTGIYESANINGAWGEPARVILEKRDESALNGCEFVQGDVMWFCSAREGYVGINLFTAKKKNSEWSDISYAGDKLMKDYQVGEMHITADGDEMYFHSSRAGGKGQFDIWVTKKVNGEWQAPENVTMINSTENDGWPFVSEDGKELWFLRTYQGTPAIFRSKKSDGVWQKPELIISQFAGEPTLDKDGNLYFVHHYYKDGKMLEADIYWARKK